MPAAAAAAAAAAAVVDTEVTGGSRVAMIAAYFGAKHRQGFRAERRSSTIGILRRVFL